MNGEGINWQPIVKTKTSLLFQWFVFEGNKNRHFRSSLGLDFEFKNEKIVADEIFIDANEWGKLENLLNIKINTEKNYLRKFVKSCYQYSDKLIKTSKYIGKETNDLLKNYKKYQNAVLSLIPFLNTTIVLDGVIKSEIVKHFENKLGVKDKKEQDLLISKLIIPKKDSYFVKETDSLLQIALKLQKDKKTKIEKDVDKHLRRFAWTTSLAYLGTFLTKDDVTKKLTSLLKENPEKRLKKVKKIKEETKKDYKAAFSQIRDIPELVELIDIAREFIYLQTYRLDVFFQAHYHIYPFLNNIADKLGIGVNELVYLTGNEIEIAYSENKVNKQEIEDRIKNFALVKVEGNYHILSGSDVKKTVSGKIIARIVKGTVANRGRATGTVKLLYEMGDIRKVNKGDIVISPMTRPELVPAIIKSAGIITDFGGILSHAAIISREFGIPCIVGTKNVTKIFKDGDMIELNAYEGIARKLE